jgi:exoribonuclease R
MGLDMFARCTSPLRRYGDLLLHWQVESALLEEARLGRSLVGNTKDDFLPFTRAQVDALLPRLDTRERVIAYGKRASNRHWLCLFLLRAWKFKEAKIPSKFPFVVRGVDHVNGNILGVMGTFLAGATCAMPTWASPADFRPGDKLEVELADVNVYQQHIFVKALRRLDSAESGTL